MCISFPTFIFTTLHSQEHQMCTYSTHAHTARNNGREERAETDKNEYTQCVYTEHTPHQLRSLKNTQLSQPAIHLHSHNTYAAGKQAGRHTHTHAHTTKHPSTVTVYYTMGTMRWQQIKSIKIRKSFFPFTSFGFGFLSLHFLICS